MATLNKEIQKAIEEENNVLYREEIYINGSHEYDYHKRLATPSTTVHTLYFSDNPEWAPDRRKQIAMQLVDTGNGIELIGVNSKKTIQYLEAEQLHILLRLSSSHSVYQIAEPAPKKDF